MPTPAQGGDGRAVNDSKHKLHGMSSTTGTMTLREEALRRKDGALTTD